MSCPGIPEPDAGFASSRADCHYESARGSVRFSVANFTTRWNSQVIAYPYWTPHSYRFVSCGPCEVRSDEFFCAGADKGDDINAGDITLSSARQTSHHVYKYTHPNTYELYNSGPDRFTLDGEPLLFSAQGGSDIPAFSRELIGPSRVIVTRPGLEDADAGTLTLRRGRSFAVHWTKGGSGDVVVTLYQAAASGYRRSVWCTYPADAGMGVIPGDILSTFTPTQGTLVVGIKTLERFVSNGYEVLLSDEIPAGRPGDDADYGYSFNLQ